MCVTEYLCVKYKVMRHLDIDDNDLPMYILMGEVDMSYIVMWLTEVNLCISF